MQHSNTSLLPVALVVFAGKVNKLQLKRSLLLGLWTICFCCHAKDMVRGCRIHEGQCFCSIGCESDFKYANREECRAALKGRGRDACWTTPCANKGICTQTSIGQGYRCRCEGTGFYGPRCQYACPIPGSSSIKVFPYECLVI